jgi:hypothetical protein
MVTKGRLRWQVCPRCSSSLVGRTECPCWGHVVDTRTRPSAEAEDEEERSE